MSKITIEITKKNGTTWREECSNMDDVDGYVVILKHTHKDLEKVEIVKGADKKVVYKS